jgi:hypothetical protein
MTVAQLVKRLSAVEKSLSQLRKQWDYDRAVEGIRRGLESADRGEGEPARRTFANLRRKYKATRRR